MKTTLDSDELIEMGACREGFDVFYEAHGDEAATLSEALDSNGWDDIWWYLTEAWAKLSKRQQDEINLLGCEWAERVLDNYEKEFPGDDRPRKAINAKRNFVAGNTGKDELYLAESAAWAAAESAAWAAAESAAESAAWAAARSARAAARSAAWSAAWAARSAVRSAARSAAMEEMKNDLRNLFLKWEGEA